MNDRAYYNEIDPYAAQWLRNLISAGLIAPGDVDERSIVDVQAGDLAGYCQCHFFAGIGGWSVALRLAGWPDDRPVWTGSCPCQPFSAAGKGKAGDDERHLWPAWFPIIAERIPPVVFGEQVEAAIGWGWLDAVFADMEGQGYACGAADIGAASVGAPHIRQRLWWVADADRERREGERLRLQSDPSGRDTPNISEIAGGRKTSELAHADGLQPEQPSRAGARSDETEIRWPLGQSSGRSDLSGLGHAEGDWQRLSRISEASVRRTGEAGRSGAWSDGDWLPCRDGKSRPVEPGTFPLAHGIPSRVGRLRAYGNAIVPQVAAEFIGAFLDCE